MLSKRKKYDIVNVKEVRGLKRKGLSGSDLKLLACLCMLIDHIGSRLLPQYTVLRLIGRLAFPIFAFCLAEGCRYTRHKGKHLALIAGVGIAWEILLILYYGEWDGNILLTFSLSTILIYLLQYAKRQAANQDVFRTVAAFALLAAAIGGVYCLTQEVYVQYRFFGVLAAPMMSLFDYSEDRSPRWMKRFDRLPIKLILLAIALVLQAWPTIGRTVQIYSLCAIPLLALYNGEAGNRRLKYGFYVFYPLHLIIIECIRLAIF